jgi:uncharacterized protein
MHPVRRRSLRAPPLSLLLTHVLALPSLAQERGSGGDFLDADVASVGVDLQSGAPLALLHSGWEHLLPVWIGDAEAAAILRGLRGEDAPRPMTHDLLLSVMAELGGHLEEIRVHSVSEGTYIGSLLVRVTGEAAPREIDSRPSDALALAVRTGARIRVARALVADAPDVDFVATAGAAPVVRFRGVTVQDEAGTEGGVLVLHVIASVAAGGLRPGDRLVEVDGRRVGGSRGFLEALRAIPDAAAASLRVMREGRSVEIRLPPRRGGGRVG